MGLYLLKRQPRGRPVQRQGREQSALSIGYRNGNRDHPLQEFFVVGSVSGLRRSAVSESKKSGTPRRPADFCPKSLDYFRRFVQILS